jgi:hypothetical protein
MKKLKKLNLEEVAMTSDIVKKRAYQQNSINP